MELSEVFIRVLPIALAGALSPFNVSVVILMLLSKDRPIARSLAFVGGFTLSLVVIGTIALGIVSQFYAPPLRARAYILILGLGVLLILLGARQVIAKHDPDEPPKAWMERVSKFRAITAFGVGFFISMFGVKTISVYIACLGIITTAGLSLPETILMIAVVVFFIISTMLLPIEIYIVQPERGPDTLRRLRDWMTNRQHVVAGAILVLVGIVLIYLGVSGLVEV
jgi:hypothetical protein